jgi:hypothetical protein
MKNSNIGVVELWKENASNTLRMTASTCAKRTKNIYAKNAG